MAEIHQEMSELLDKQVNAETEKSFRGLRKLPQAHEKKCAIKIKVELGLGLEKNHAYVKMLFLERRPL